MHSLPSVFIHTELASFAIGVKAPCTHSWYLRRYFLLCLCVLFSDLAFAEPSQHGQSVLHFETPEVILSDEGIRLVAPLQLNDTAWSIRAEEGSWRQTEDCPSAWQLGHVFGTRQGIIRISADEIRGCATHQRTSLSNLRLTIGRLQLQAHSTIYEPKIGLSAQSVQAKCGTYVPLLMHAKHVREREEDWVLEDVKLEVAGTPIAWFPSIKLNAPGTPGLLPPRLSMTRSGFAATLPLYTPIGTQQNLILAPGYQYQSRSGHHGFGRVDYQWSNERAQLGTLSVVARQQAVGLFTKGSVHAQSVYAYSRGSSWWGQGNNLPSQTRSLQNRIGFGYTTSGIRWSRQGTSLKMDASRAIETLEDRQTFSQLHLAGSQHFDWAWIASTVSHDSWLGLEAGQSWLGHSQAAVSVNRAWNWARLESQSRLGIQSIHLDPRNGIEDDQVRHVPIADQSIVLLSDWARPFHGWTHGLHLGAGALGQYRRGPSFSPLDPLAGFGRSSIRGYVEVGTDLRKTHRLARITVRQVGTEMSRNLPRQFTELAMQLSHTRFRLESRYAHRRQTFISGRLNVVSALTLHSTFLYQEKPVVLNRLWVSPHNGARPTLRHGVEWSGRSFGIQGDLWHLAERSVPSAASIRFDARPDCECIRLVSDIQYQQQNNALLFMLNLDLDVAPQRPILRQRRRR